MEHSNPVLTVTQKSTLSVQITEDLHRCQIRMTPTSNLCNRKYTQFCSYQMHGRYKPFFSPQYLHLNTSISYGTCSLLSRTAQLPVRQTIRLGTVPEGIAGTVLNKIIVAVNITETCRVLHSKQETVRLSGQPKSRQFSIKSAPVTLGNCLCR